MSDDRGFPLTRPSPTRGEGESIRATRHRDFAAQIAYCTDPVSRRRFLKLMGASVALAGVTACTSPPHEKIVPYVRAPEEAVPGKPLFYASATSLGGFATGVLVESHLGRPTKVEGNPQHPASLGATDAAGQASVLTLYDPNRAKAITNRGRIRTWTDLLRELRSALEAQRTHQGAGLRILTETVTSPTLASQIQTLLAQIPQAGWHQYEPIGSDNARDGTRLAFGEDVDAQYRLDRADVILALDADFMGWSPGRLRYVRDFAARRRALDGAPGMNRLYVVEPSPSITGANADHSLPLRAAEVEGFARAVAAALWVDAGPGPSSPPASVPPDWLAALVRDLRAHPGTGLVMAGDPQPPIVHALAHALNQALGNVGNTVIYTPPVAANPVDQGQSLQELVGDMAAGRVEILAILGGNPVYTAPADLGFEERLTNVALSVYLGLYEDETAARCQWHIPQTHELETWSDARAFDGTVTIAQPLIAPLYAGRSAHELLAAFGDRPEAPSHDLVKEYWQSQRSTGDFEQFWRTALHDGLVAGTALPPRGVTLRADWAAGAQAGPADGRGGLEIVLRPDPTVYDGRFAANGWLQELPKPLTSLTWDNAALISPATAQRLGLANEDLVELRYRGQVVRAPIWVIPGHADDSVTLPLGYGRTRGAGAANGAGFNAYALRVSTAPWFDQGLEIVKTGERYSLAGTQGHHRMEGREIVRAASFEEYRRNPDFPHDAPREHAEPISLYPGYQYEGYAWGMAIDLSTCVGCSACVVACQAENNIPVVGKDQVLRQREMHWLRVDTYEEGEPNNPHRYAQPVPCMQCENAPCELVCPVAATSHSSEGLNDMVYNRCVGTRYCSNNCPYKVRRFNFFEYADFETPSLKLLRNPDVTVRSRGVMEKCTYCVQRISAARIEAEKEGRSIRDGEAVTACQAACPADAIVFGNLNDPNSRVAQLKASSRNYALLEELNTRPRTTYLAAIRNPNPDIGTER
jgi:Fe-S-cluster-containing dehydrogenase component